MKRFVVKNMCTDVSDEAQSTVIRKKNILKLQVSLRTWYLFRTTRFHVPEIPELYITPDLTLTKCTSKVTNTVLSLNFL